MKTPEELKQMKYIDCIEAWEPGAPVSVDLVHLKDGRVLGISSDCIVLYDSLADFETCDTNEKPTISLYRKESIGAYATVLFHDDKTPMEGLYFHFGDLPEDDINDDNVFFYADGEHEMKDMMKNGALDFKVLSYELHYD